MRARSILFSLAVIGVLPAGCLSRPIEPVDVHTTTTFTQALPNSVGKIDLLLAIDNSSSMSDKQRILAEAVPDLVRGLLNPRCVDDAGHPLPQAQQPLTPTDTCPGGSTREFQAVFDVHVGIVSSSMGGYNGKCLEGQGKSDDGELVARVAPGTPAVPTYQGQEFLAWDPLANDDPPGEKDFASFQDHLGALVAGVGQQGCGYESQLESFYRFLVEPHPYDQIAVGDDGNYVTTSEDDATIINQRKDFLRPDSLVAILVLTDENDCSVVETGDNARIKRLDGHPPRGRAVCMDHPDDHCCAPCGEAPADCPNDPICDKPLDGNDDPTDLRCFEQKRRFGRDYLYPVQRYVDGLSQSSVVDRHGDMSPNPLFPGTAAGITGRTPSSGLVFFAGIVGVPWQDIARRNAKGQPDLVQGLDADGNVVGGFQSYAEMLERGPWGSSTWDLVLGDPDRGVKPADALMVESSAPRQGMNPVLGVALAPETSTNPLANPINGHEWTPLAPSEAQLQYACIFDLKPPQACTGDYCDCQVSDNTPICQDASGAHQQELFRAKAFPGVRQLQVLKGLGEQGIVASICPAQLDTKGQPDYGYSPAVGAIIERLKTRLGDPCLPLQLTPQKADGPIACLVLEAHETSDGCACDTPGRKPVVGKGPLDAAAEAEREGAAFGKDYACFCEIDQLLGDERSVCQNDTGHAPQLAGKPVDGWCYVDPALGQGNEKLVTTCPADEKREMRFVNGGIAERGTTLYVSCAE